MGGAQRERVEQRGGHRAPSILAACAATAGGLALVIGAGLAPHGNGRVVAVFPPWWSEARAMNAAGSAGSVAAVGGFRNVVLIRSDSAGLEQRASAAGALLLLDPAAAIGCARKAVIRS